MHAEQADSLTFKIVQSAERLDLFDFENDAGHEQQRTLPATPTNLCYTEARLTQPCPPKKTPHSRQALVRLKEGPISRDRRRKADCTATKRKLQEVTKSNSCTFLV